MMLLYAGTMFGWFWSIGNGLQHKVPPTVKMKAGKFKIFFLIPLLYMAIIVIGFSYMFTGMPETVEHADESNIGLLGVSMAIISPLHLFSMFCVFYCLYFVAKTLKTIEFQREVSFADFAGEFFMIWFYFIGIWIIQPRVNKIASGELGSANPFDSSVKR